VTSDELLARKWLHGEDNDRRLGIEPGRAALIRLLRNPPLSSEICAVLARMFDDVSVGEMRLTLSSRRGPGAPRKDGTVKGLAKAKDEVNRKRQASKDTVRRAGKMFLRKRKKPRKPKAVPPRNPLLKQGN
jgi:hypothetical protein